MCDSTDQLQAAALSAAANHRLRAALDAASREYLRVFATHREALEAAIHVYLVAASPDTSDVLRFSGARFPVQSDEGRPKSVPWAMVAEHEAQALKNHQQTLARLAERGGLGVDELWCVIHDQPFAHRPRPEWCDAWLSGINDLRVALVQAVHAERIAREPVAAVEPEYDGPPTDEEGK